MLQQRILIAVRFHLTVYYTAMGDNSKVMAASKLRDSPAGQSSF